MEWVRVRVVVCWLWLMLQVVLFSAGERVWLWEWLDRLLSQGVRDGLLDPLGLPPA